MLDTWTTLTKSNLKMIIQIKVPPQGNKKGRPVTSALRDVSRAEGCGILFLQKVVCTVKPRQMGKLSVLSCVKEKTLRIIYLFVSKKF